MKPRVPPTKSSVPQEQHIHRSGGHESDPLNHEQTSHRQTPRAFESGYEIEHGRRPKTEKIDAQTQWPPAPESPFSIARLSSAHEGGARPITYDLLPEEIQLSVLDHASFKDLGQLGTTSFAQYGLVTRLIRGMSTSYLIDAVLMDSSVALNPFIYKSLQNRLIEIRTFGRISSEQAEKWLQLSDFLIEKFTRSISHLRLPINNLSLSPTALGEKDKIPGTAQRSALSIAVIIRTIVSPLTRPNFVGLVEAAVQSGMGQAAISFLLPMRHYLDSRRTDAQPQAIAVKELYRIARHAGVFSAFRVRDYSLSSKLLDLLYVESPNNVNSEDGLDIRRVVMDVIFRLHDEAALEQFVQRQYLDYLSRNELEREFGLRREFRAIIAGGGGRPSLTTSSARQRLSQMEANGTMQRWQTISLKVSEAYGMPAKLHDAAYRLSNKLKDGGPEEIVKECEHIAQFALYRFTRPRHVFYAGVIASYFTKEEDYQLFDCIIKNLDSAVRRLVGLNTFDAVQAAEFLNHVKEFLQINFQHWEPQRIVG